MSIDDENSPGPARKPSGVCLTLPLEIQEHIISRGPQRKRARIAFLSLCSLVCKDWLPKSRSLLALNIVNSRDMLSIMEMPLTTLSTSSFRSAVIWEKKMLTVLAANFHSIQKLTLSIDREGLDHFLPESFSMPSIRVLVLSTLVVSSKADFSTLIACFPRVDYLDLRYISISPHHTAPFLDPSKIPATTLTEITFPIGSEWAIAALNLLLAVSPCLRTLQLRFSFAPIMAALASWATQSLVIKSDIHLSLEIREPHAETASDDSFISLIGMADSITLSYLTRGYLRKTLPWWLPRASHIQSLTFKAADWYGPVDSASWTALFNSLRAGGHVKVVRFLEWTSYEGIPAYIEGLSGIGTPSFELFFQMNSERDSVDRVVL